MARKDRTVERELARLARSAHGVIARRELLRAGVNADEINHRLGSGALIPVHRGVYRIGHDAPSIEARYMAAVKACGDGALLAGRAAGHLLGILGGRPPRPEVLAPKERRIPGVTTHRYRVIHPSEATRWRGIPVTACPRTLVDLAAVLGSADLARACHEADIRHRVTPADVEAVLVRRPRSRGAGELRRVLRGDVAVTLSRLEERFRERLGEAGLPLPQMNGLVGGRRVDCRWPERRLTVELDGYRYHHSRHAWEQDRLREREARARGEEFRRFSYGDVFERPEQMLAELRELLV